MSTSKQRTRSRVTSNKLKSGSVELGATQFWQASNQKWGGFSFQKAYTPSSGFYQRYGTGQITMDYLHHGPPYREGDPFKSLRIVTCLPLAEVVGSGTYVSQDGLRRYVGGFTIPRDIDFGAGYEVNPVVADLSLSSPLFPSMAGWGDKAWSKTRPNPEKASGAVFLAEGRDLPRMLKGTAHFFQDIWKSLGGDPISKTMSPKKVADHFLNHQFGWVPFVSDMKKFSKSFQDSQSILDKLSDRNGKFTKRRVTLKADSTFQKLASGDGVKLYPDSSFTTTPGQWFQVSRPATWELWEELEISITAAGKWYYYVPEFDRTDPDYMSAMNRIHRQITLYGLRISPANIYKATPWSWALDWVSKVGDHIDDLNAQLLDSVACKYLYVMQHMVRKRVLIQRLPFANMTVTLRFDRIIETKQRDEALSPYGFGLSLANLTPRQIAIAGALGISRA